MENEKCLALIQLYNSKGMLWNSKFLITITKVCAKNKITTLLASYRREKSRIKKSHITGSAAGTVYVSKWFALSEFDFMAGKDTPNDTVDTFPDVFT
ncbi:hypothetical protein B7P43_G09053 [Cryptotermes secundus]|uniref:MADF domain-containing protein n=1 Tax=Cryptotermes secundus TaxID=105785 RepID=A0A2J7PHP4_9NEOP|nr:hypothetical protein B7P43_G09053 [Cryptotermes secundus]